MNNETPAVKEVAFPEGVFQMETVAEKTRRFQISGSSQNVPERHQPPEKDLSYSQRFSSIPHGNNRHLPAVNTTYQTTNEPISSAIHVAVHVPQPVSYQQMPQQPGIAPTMTQQQRMMNPSQPAYQDLSYNQGFSSIPHGNNRHLPAVNTTYQTTNEPIRNANHVAVHVPQPVSYQQMLQQPGIAPTMTQQQRMMNPSQPAYQASNEPIRNVNHVAVHVPQPVSYQQMLQQPASSLNSQGFTPVSHGNVSDSPSVSPIYQGSNSSQGFFPVPRRNNSHLSAVSLSNQESTYCNIGRQGHTGVNQQENVSFSSQSPDCTSLEYSSSNTGSQAQDDEDSPSPYLNAYIHNRDKRWTSAEEHVRGSQPPADGKDKSTYMNTYLQTRNNRWRAEPKQPITNRQQPRTQESNPVYEEIANPKISHALNQKILGYMSDSNFSKHAFFYLINIVEDLRQEGLSDDVICLGQSNFESLFNLIIHVSFDSQQAQGFCKQMVKEILDLRDFRIIPNFKIIEGWALDLTTDVKMMTVHSEINMNNSVGVAQTLSRSSSPGSLFSDVGENLDHLKPVSARYNPRSAKVVIEHTSNALSPNVIFDEIGIGSPKLSSISVFSVMTLSMDDCEENTFYKQYLRHLVMLDYRVRDDLPKQRETNKSTGSTSLRAAFSASNTSAEGESNPMDLLVAIFLCCNPVLRQIYFEKLFICKLAIPLMLSETKFTPPLFFLWALRSVVAEWREQDQAQEKFLADVPLTVVSMIRFGECNRSKSNILNNVLSPTAHSVFFHRDRPLGKSPRRLTNGMVEGAFYLPSGNGVPEDLFPSLSLICNLRGDALKYSSQLDVLKSVSHLIILLVDKSCFYDETVSTSFLGLFNGHCVVHLLITVRDNQNDMEQDIDTLESVLERAPENRYTYTVLRDGAMNEADEKAVIIGAIQEAKFGAHAITIPDIAKCAAKHNFFVDENELQESKRIANEFSSAIVKRKTPKITLLPLQGEPWKEITRVERTAGRSDQKQRTQESVEKYKKDLATQRTTQQNLLRRCEPCVKSCVSRLSDTATDRSSLESLLRWYKFYFDRHSREVLPNLLRQLHKEYQGHVSAMKAKATEAQLKAIAKKIDGIEKRIEDESIGLEHVLRELGQMYEAQIGPPKPRSAIQMSNPNVLLNIAVAILLSGQPFEIMNGDGEQSNIPLTWVQAVLGHLRKAIGDEKIFVLSILGVQSSGKSTLLNSMFGIQFAVSAGRCTKGIFIQLIEASGCPFKYAVIIDTEGLRANEIKKRNHDNELATLSIGLGDVTIVNIKGENNAEIEDVLQIAVQAFLRMKAVYPNIKLHQRCIFAHQNVAATNAREKLMVGRKKLLESLDFITANAAEDEGQLEIRQFTDVIEFDMMEDVCYFPDLWFGSPPMAHVNPKYTDTVRKVKNHIFKKYAVQQNSFLKFSEFSERIGDLWKAIISDNFVYGFRNHLEIKTYAELEMFYNQVCLDFDQETDGFIDRLEIMIKSNNIVNKVQEAYNQAAVNLNLKLIEIEDFYVGQIESFFECHEHKKILSQWRHLRLRKFSAVKGEKQVTASAALRKTQAEATFTCQELEAKGEFEQRLRTMAVDLAKKQQTSGRSIQRDDQEKHFGEEFNKMLERFRQQVPKDNINISLQMQKVLLEVCPENFLNYVLEELQKHKWEKDNLKVLLDQNFYETTDISILKHEENRRRPEFVQAVVNSFSGDVVQEIDGVMSSLVGKFNPSNAAVIFRSLLPKYTEFNLAHKTKFSITRTCIAKVYVLVCHHTERVFKKRHDEYNKKHGIMAQLEGYRPTALGLFLKLFNNSCKEEVAAFLFCSELEQMMKQSISKQIYQSMCADISVHFNGKFWLLAAILEDLVEVDDSGKFMEYISNPKAYALQYLTDFTNAMFQSENDVRHEKKGNVFKHGLKAIKAIKAYFTGKDTQHQNESGLVLYAIKLLSPMHDSILEAVKMSNRSTIQAWLAYFKQATNKLFPIRPSDFEQVLEQGVSDVTNFSESVEKCLSESRDNVLKHFRGFTASDFPWSGDVKPQKVALDKLWGCEALCPFCREPCQLGKDHIDETSHRCIQHKPRGLNNWHYRGNRKLTTDACSFSIATDTHKFYCAPCEKAQRCTTCEPQDDNVKHLYKDYKLYTIKWEILPSDTSDNFKYWQYVMKNIHKDIAKVHKYEPADIPDSWKHLTKETAIETLKEVFCVTKM